MAAKGSQAGGSAGGKGRRRIPGPPAVQAVRVIRKLPKPGIAKNPSGSQKLLFVAWGAAIGMSAIHDVIIAKDWPCPGRYVKITGLFLVLALLAEVNPRAARLASMLGVGFTLVYFTREASKEIVKTGTFFGIKVK